MTNKEKAIAIQAALTEMNALIKARKQHSDASRERMNLAMQHAEDLSAGQASHQFATESSPQLRPGAGIELLKILVYGENERVPVGTAGKILRQAEDDADGTVWLVDYGKFGRAVLTPAASILRLTPGRF